MPTTWESSGRCSTLGWVPIAVRVELDLRSPRAPTPLAAQGSYGTRPVVLRHLQQLLARMLGVLGGKVYDCGCCSGGAGMKSRPLKARTARDMAPTEAAWLAGYLDGDGSICVYKGGGKSHSRCWMLQISSGTLDTMMHCHKISGTGSIFRKKGKRSDDLNAHWVWRVNRRLDMAYILQQIMPYLVVKKLRAENCLKAFREEIGTLEMPRWRAI